MFNPPRLPFFGFPFVATVPSETIWRGVENALQVSEPARNAALAANFEMTSYVAGRTRAAMEFPAELMRCTTPDQVLAAQMRFWQSAMADTTRTTERLLRGMRQAAPAAVAQAETAMGAVRDIMALPETAPPDAKAPARKPRVVSPAAAA